MKRNHLLISISIVMALIACSCFSQGLNDTIHYDKKYGQFYQHETKIKSGEMLDIMFTNKEAYNMMWKARKYNIAGKVFLITGAAGFGYMIVDFLRTGQINYYALGIGAGIALVSIPLNNEYKNRAKKAVIIYNTGLSKTSQYDYRLNFGISENGLGVKFSF
jgi:hypothetical protein